MRVILIDPYTSGHHVEYASYFIRYFVKAGDEVTLVTWEPHPLLQALESFPVKIAYARHCTGNRGNGSDKHLLGRWMQMFQTVELGIRIGVEDSADIVHHLYADRSELVLEVTLFWRKYHRLPLFYATLFWPYFVSIEGCRSSFVKSVYHSLNRRVIKHLLCSDRVKRMFVHHHSIREQVLRALDEPSLSERFTVIPDPVDFQSSNIPKERARENLGLPQDSIIFLVFGGMRRDKGPDIVLQALPFVKGECTVVFAGEAGIIDRSTIESLTLALSENIRLISRFQWASQQESNDYFAAADCILVPYRRCYSGTSGVVQRAAAAGRPVIASEVGVISEVVRDNDLGITVQPESPAELARAMDCVIAKPDEWLYHRAQVVRRYAHECNWRVTAQRTREAYLEDLVGKA